MDGRRRQGLAKSFERYLRARRRVGRWKPSTASNRFRALRQFFRYLLDESGIATIAEYGASAADERAREAHKPLALGDRL